MQLLALLAAATGTAALAMPNGGGVFGGGSFSGHGWGHLPGSHGNGNGHSNGWALKKFTNLVAFGDR